VGVRAGGARPAEPRHQDRRVGGPRAARPDPVRRRRGRRGAGGRGPGAAEEPARRGRGAGHRRQPPGDPPGPMSAPTAPPIGHFGQFGGRFVPEALVPALQELSEAYAAASADPAFRAEFDRMLREYASCPSPLYHATRLSAEVGARLLLKREDLNHTGAHKIRNVLGQALLTRRMGKRRVIAETGAGQHGVATATACSYLDLECVVYMGEVDTERQALNVARM